MTTLREKMKREMVLMGLASSTQKRYLQEIEKLNDFYSATPNQLSSEQLQAYLLHLKKRDYRLIPTM